jgi:peptidoglycan/LPS O-acetylase OafA/YrhL
MLFLWHVWWTVKCSSGMLEFFLKRIQVEVIFYLLCAMCYVLFFTKLMLLSLFSALLAICQCTQILLLILLALVVSLASRYLYYTWSALFGLMVTIWPPKSSITIGIYLVLVCDFLCHSILSDPPCCWLNLLCIASAQSPGLVPMI